TLTLYHHCFEVVCDLPLKGDRGGPASIFMTARLFLSLHDTLVTLDHTHPHGFVLPPWCISPTSPRRTLRRVEPKWAFVKTEAADSDTASRIFPESPSRRVQHAA
ncbi:MAG TPA: hypothetical protein VMA74_20465, partial [Dyella sp.]|uniref:hypothetical protein n=1 Tax=Dyella sp. TaxID=1869338 RepID=UPI002C90F3D9